jgi:hypothetical protein
MASVKVFADRPKLYALYLSIQGHKIRYLGYHKGTYSDTDPKTSTSTAKNTSYSKYHKDIQRWVDY